MGLIIIRKCPRCEILFDCYCQSNSRCWCFDITINEDTQKRISQNFSGCLCPECLKSFDETGPMANDNPSENSD
jgi:ribosomal protein L34E